MSEIMTSLSIDGGSFDLWSTPRHLNWSDVGVDDRIPIITQLAYKLRWIDPRVAMEIVKLLFTLIPPIKHARPINLIFLLIIIYFLAVVHVYSQVKGLIGNFLTLNVGRWTAACSLFAL